MTIRLRLTLVYSAILTLTLGVFGVALYTIQSQDTLNSLEQDLVLSSNKFTDAFLKTGVVILPFDNTQQEAPPPRPFDQIGDEQVFRNLREREIVRILDADGNLIASPYGLAEDALPLSEDALDKLQHNKAIFESGTVLDESMLIYNRPVNINGEIAYIIQIARPLTERNRTLQSLATTLIIAGGTMVLVAFGVGWFLSGLTLRPIDRITQTAKSIGEERDFSRRVNHTGKQDEVGRLANTFNQMLGRLQEGFQKVEKSLDQQRNFVSDVSHELRTPLTTLRGNLGLLRHTPPIPVEEQEDILTDMVVESDRMIRLVNELLMLAHADAGRSLAKEEVSVNSVIEDVVRQSKHLDPNRQVNLAITGEPVIKGDRDALKQIILIILDNAIKYSQKEILVTSGLDGQNVKISVQDKGQGIPEEDRTKIFERFYRGEENPVIQGFGLGLPIAKSLAEAMGGTIEIESHLGEGSTVTVSFALVNYD